MKKGSWFAKCRAMLCIILCFAMVLPFAGCKRNEASKNEDEDGTETAPAMVATDDVGSPTDAGLPTIEISEETESEDTMPEETEPEDNVTEEQKVTLSRDEQYRINIFLSNFSEQWFHEWSDEKFESQNSDIREMVDFTWMYTKLNKFNAVEYILHDDEPYYVVDIDVIDSYMQRFFGRTVTLEEVVHALDDDPMYIVIGNQIGSVAADGETYNNMTVANTMYDLGNGTMLVEFDIYSLDLDSRFLPGPGTIDDKSVYYYTPEDAAEDSDFEHHLSGVAVVRPYTTDAGKETYQLISYKLICEDEEQDEEPMIETPQEDTGSSYVESITKEEILGEWNVDTEYTMQYNGKSINDMFGHQSYTDSMSYGADNSFEYYVVFEGGKGQYRIDENHIDYSIITYNGEKPESGEIWPQVIDGKFYLVQQTYQYSIFWEKT